MWKKVKAWLKDVDRRLQAGADAVEEPETEVERLAREEAEKTEQVHKSHLESIATWCAILSFVSAVVSCGVAEDSPIHNTPFFGYGIAWLILAALEGIRVNMK